MFSQDIAYVLALAGDLDSCQTSGALDSPRPGFMPSVEEMKVLEATCEASTRLSNAYTFAELHEW